MLVNGEKLSYNETMLHCSNNKKNNNVTMSNTVSDSDKFRLRQRKTEYIADKLVEKFNAPQWRKFFLKIAWHLSENAIWSTLEMAFTKKVTKPLNYFIAACNKQMAEVSLRS
ncbi:hypothetical protein IKF88_00685 [Candidatus Saccharibacteria bacterium]|nr:hypothetical protein [Candidatus Saccharibacteria bacterium]